MSETTETLARAVALIRQRLDAHTGGVLVRPDVLMVLGSGLGDWAETLEDALVIPYADVPGMGASTVIGHRGQWRIGRLGSRWVMAMQGRMHGYEGWSPQQVVQGVRMARGLGVRTLVVTNAAGSLDPSLGPGTLMLIRDHINLTGQNPLVGHNDAAMGPRFPDMSDVYTARLRSLAREVADGRGIPLAEGVYVGVLGPTYETAAEVRAYGRLGGQAVGMSTVWEVIAARHAGMQVLGVSCLTNLGTGLGDAPLDHADVEHVARQARSAFSRLLDGVVSHPGLPDPGAP